MTSKQYTTKATFNATVECTFGGNMAQHRRDADRRCRPYPSDSAMTKCRSKLLLPAIKQLHNQSVKKALNEYREWYLFTHPSHPKNQAVPIGLSMDTRWNKRWGWNSLDGHGIGRIDCPDPKTPLPYGMRICIGAFPYHRSAPGELSKARAEHFEVFEASAGAMDPKSIEDAIQLLLDNGFDPVLLLHDNDAKGIKRAREIKKRALELEPVGSTRYQRCVCHGKMQDKNGDFCVDGSLCFGINESLCSRHGAGHAGKEMMDIARNHPEVALPRNVRKKSTRWHWLCSDKCKRYFSKMYRQIAIDSNEASDMQIRLEGLLEHMQNIHTSKYCHEHGACCEPLGEGDVYEQSFVARTEEEKAVLNKWFKKYGDLAICQKYTSAKDTNAEEHLNSIMIMLMEKKLFSCDAVRYEICAMICALFLNERGWNFEKELYKLVGYDQPRSWEEVVDRREEDARTTQMHKNSALGLSRRVELGGLRTGQNKNSKKYTDHRSNTRHNDTDDTLKRKRSSKSRKCGVAGCGSTDHTATTCNHPNAAAHRSKLELKNKKAKIEKSNIAVFQRVLSKFQQGELKDGMVGGLISIGGPNTSSSSSSSSADSKISIASTTKLEKAVNTNNSRDCFALIDYKKNFRGKSKIERWLVKVTTMTRGEEIVLEMVSELKDGKWKKCKPSADLMEWEHVEELHFVQDLDQCLRT